MLLALSLSMGCLAGGPPSGDPPWPAGLGALRLNELDACQAGVDDAEFVELRGEPGLALSDVWLVLFNGSGDGPFPAYRTVSLDGWSLPADGLLVIGAPSVAGMDLAVFPTNAVQNGPDLAVLYHAPGAVAAAVGGSTWPTGPPGAARLDALLHVSGDVVSPALLATLGATPGAGVAVADEHALEAAPAHSLQRLAVAGAEGPLAPYFAQPPTPGAHNGEAWPAAIHDVQGAGSVSPLEGRAVAGVTGVVTALVPGGLQVQAADAEADTDEATSEAVFVRTGVVEDPHAWDVGDAVVVDGGVLERRSGAGDLPRTELVAARIVPGPEARLPAPVVLGPGGRWPPTQVVEDDIEGLVGAVPESFEPQHDGLDFLESLEGMRVALVGARATGVRDASGQVFVTLAGGRASTGVNARGGLTRRPGDDNPERVPLRLGFDGPAVQVGDRWPDVVVGRLDDAWGGYAVFPEGAPPDALPGGLAPETTALGPPERDELRLATFNVQNLSPATEPERRARLARLVVGALRSPDLLALQEIQDDSGPVDDGQTGAAANLALLVEAIETAGGPRYAAWEIAPEDGADGGQPGGNIRVALLVAPTRGLQLVERGRAGPTDAVEVLPGATGPLLSLSPGRVVPLDPAFWWSRKPLAAELCWRGRPLFVIVNHFVSKSGDDALYGAQQPPATPSSVQRRAQATVVAGLVSGLLALDPDAAVVVLGDLNDGDASETLDVLTEAGLVDLVTRLPPLERYTHLYRGQGEALDHVLVSAALAEGAALDVVHAAAEFAKGPSDHDPVLVGLRPVEDGTRLRGPRRPARCSPPSPGVRRR